MFLAIPVKRDKNYEIRLLWYFSILYIWHINDQLFLFLSYFFVCFPTLFLLFLKLRPTFILLFYICLPESLTFVQHGHGKNSRKIVAFNYITMNFRNVYCRYVVLDFVSFDLM
jgi:hypothetical protein